MYFETQEGIVAALERDIVKEQGDPAQRSFEFVKSMRTTEAEEREVVLDNEVMPLPYLSRRPECTRHAEKGTKIQQLKRDGKKHLFERLLLHIQ